MRLVRKSTYHSDLRSIIRYIGNESPRAAMTIVGSIESSVRRLSNFPELGRTGRVEGTRELVVAGTAFIVIYTVTTKIKLWRVLHGAQHWPPEINTSDFSG